MNELKNECNPRFYVVNNMYLQVNKQPNKQQKKHSLKWINKCINYLYKTVCINNVIIIIIIIIDKKISL